MRKPRSGAFLFYLLLRSSQDHMQTQRLFNIAGSADFQSLAIEMFRYQYNQNEVYRQFCDLIKTGPGLVERLIDIPFLPIELFKTKKVVCRDVPIETAFLSSGTTASTPSVHHVADLAIYERSYLTAFELFYGPVQNYCILALLPSYLEREGSSLVYMVNDLIAKSKHAESGFYLHDYEGLYTKLSRLEKKKTRVLLIGVSFALLEFARQYNMRLENTIVMETGGMKGRGKELIREALHSELMQGLGVSHVHSEYGMTELLSQAYSKGDGKFFSPPWMKVLIRDTEDPLDYLGHGKTGGLNIIDLANVHSCSFLATQDLGKLGAGGYFEVLGRFDHSDIRGCNLMAL